MLWALYFLWLYPVKVVDSVSRLRDQLAALQHEIWAHWMKYLFSVSAENADGSVTIPADKVERWIRQVNTDYQRLPEREKVGDLEQADKVLALLEDLDSQRHH